MTQQAGTSNINRSYAGYLVDMGQKRRRRSKKSETKRIKNGKERGTEKREKEKWEGRTWVVGKKTGKKTEMGRGVWWEKRGREKIERKKLNWFYLLFILLV